MEDSKGYHGPFPLDCQVERASGQESGRSERTAHFNVRRLPLHHVIKAHLHQMSVNEQHLVISDICKPLQNSLDGAVGRGCDEALWLMNCT